MLVTTQLDELCKNRGPLAYRHSTMRVKPGELASLVAGVCALGKRSRWMAVEGLGCPVSGSSW